MNCEIIFGRTNGKIDKAKINAVKAPNGKRSLLYDELKAIVQDDLYALDQYYKTRTESFKNWFGEKEYYTIKPQFSGKIIYAIPGTGKSVAQKLSNKILDLDELEKELTGAKTVSEANELYENMSDEQKHQHEIRQAEAIKRAIESGRTIITSRRSMAANADYSIIHLDPDRMIQSVASTTRENPYTYSQEKAMKVINFAQNAPNKIILDNDQYVSNVIFNRNTDANNEPALIDGTYVNENGEVMEAITEVKEEFRQPKIENGKNKSGIEKKLDTELNPLLIEYLKNFDISVEVVEKTQRAINIDSLGFAHFLNRIAYVNDTKLLPEVAGEFIAYMMQYDPKVNDIIKYLHKKSGNDVDSDKWFSHMPVDKVNSYVKEVGNLIGKELKGKLIDKIDVSIWQKIIELVKDFFNKLRNTDLSKMNINLGLIADGILKRDIKLVKSKEGKPGEENQPVSLVSMKDAMRKDRLGNHIINNLAQKGFILTGSIVLSEQGTIYRPNENPLHDIDWVSPYDKRTTEKKLKETYPNAVFGGRIDNSDYSTFSYLIPPIGTKTQNVKFNSAGRISSYEFINDNGETVGESKGGVSSGLEGKTLDFFVYKDLNSLEEVNQTTTEEGTKVSIAKWENIFGAKLAYGREKDIWDYVRFIRNNDNESDYKQSNYSTAINDSPLSLDDDFKTIKQNHKEIEKLEDKKREIQKDQELIADLLNKDTEAYVENNKEEKSVSYVFIEPGLTSGTEILIYEKRGTEKVAVQPINKSLLSYHSKKDDRNSVYWKKKAIEDANFILTREQSLLDNQISIIEERIDNVVEKYNKYFSDYPELKAIMLSTLDANQEIAKQLLSDLLNSDITLESPVTIDTSNIIVSNNTFSKEQLDILNNYNKNTSNLSDEKIEVNVKDLPKRFWYLAKKGETVTLYKTLAPNASGKNYVTMRVSHKQDERFLKRRTREEVQQQENAPFSIVSRESGTQMHKMNEDILKFLVENVGEVNVNEKEEDYLNRTMALLKDSSVFKSLERDLVGGKTVFRHQVVYDDLDPDDEGFAQTDAVMSWEKLAYSMMQLYRQAYSVQADINSKTGKNQKPFFLLEKPIIDTARDEAGTMDMCVIFSDGSAAIYDHKFISYKKEKKTLEEMGYDPTKPEDVKSFYEMRRSQGLSTQVREENNWIYVIGDEFARSMSFKESSYDMQISRYAEMLTTLYGVKSIKQARILPVVVGYKLDELEGNDKEGNKRYGFTVTKDGKAKTQVQFIMTGFDNPLVRQIPISVETTDDKGLDEFVKKLADRKKKLQDEMTKKYLWRDENYRARLNQLTNGINSLLVNKDLLAIIDSGSRVLDGLSPFMEDSSKELGFEDVTSYLKGLDVYESFVELSNNQMDQLKKTDNLLYEKTKAAMNEMLGRITAAKVYLKNKRVTNLIELNEEKDYMGDLMLKSFREQTDINGIGKYLLHLREINHPLVKMFSTLLDEVNLNVMNARKKLQVNTEKYTRALQEWGNSRGLKGTDIFKLLIDKNGDLISVWDNEKYVNNLFSRAHSYTDSDKAWFKDNFYRTEKDTEIFNKKRDEAMTRAKSDIEKRIYGKDATLDDVMFKWDNDNDIMFKNGNNRAWINKSLWFGRPGGITPKNPELFYSTEYNTILRAENKPVLDYYNFYIEQINSLRNMRHIDFKERIGHNFIANITRDTIDTLAQEGGSGYLSKQWASLKELMKVKDGEDGMMKYGDLKDKAIPIMFIDRIDSDAKSFDLSKSLMIFSDFVNAYDGAKSIEHISLSIREVIASTQIIATTSTGSKAIKDGQFIKHDGTNSNLLNAMDTWLNYYIYGERDQTTTSETGKKIVQAIDKARNYISHKNLAFNLLSATAGHLNAEFQLNMLATKGNLFDKKTLNKARAESLKTLKESKSKIENFNSKSVFSYFYFEVSQENFSYERANQVSPSSLRKFFAQDKTMFMQRWSDNSIENTVLTAMMMSHAIDPINGKVYTIDRLKEIYKDDPKYKDFTWQSIWDSIDMEKVKKGQDEVGKGQKGGSIINQHTGQVISERTFINFRNKVRDVVNKSKGNMSEEDISGYKTHIVGRLLGQYRSWIPAMGKERISKPQFNLTTEQFEVGRWIAAWNVFSKGGAKVAGSFLKQIMPFMNSDFKYADNDKMRELYKQWLIDNPASDPKNNGDKHEQVSYEEFLKSYVGQTKAMAKELQVYLSCLITLYLMMFALGDDEVEDNPVWRGLAGFLDRAKLELGFFIPVAGTNEQVELFTRSPFAAVQLITDVQKTLTNTAQESWDIINGTPWDMTTTPQIGDDAWTVSFEERQDNSPLFKYTSEWIPGGKQLAGMIGWFGTTDKEDTIWDWLNSDVVK